jgi:hypothetical protein
MPITLNLTEFVEQAFEAEARIQGISTSELLQTFLLEHVPASRLPHKLETNGLETNGQETNEQATQWTRRDGIPVLESALPFPTFLIEDTLEQIRHERDFNIFGISQK